MNDTSQIAERAPITVDDPDPSPRCGVDQAPQHLS